MTSTTGNFFSRIYAVFHGPIGGAGGADTPNIVQVNFPLRKRKAEGPCIASEHIRPAVLAPAHASPSAAAGGSAARPLTRTNPSGAIPLAYPPSSTVPGFAFSRFPAAPPGRAFALHSAAVPGLAHTVAFDPTCFQGEMMPRKGHMQFSPGPPST